MDENTTKQNPASEMPKTTKNTWNVVAEVLRREYGSLQPRGDSFATQCHSSAYIAKRMKLSHHLTQPPGAVNVVNFNSRGDLLIVGLIDWAGNEVKAALETEKDGKISDVHFLNAHNYEAQLGIVSAYGNGCVRCDSLTPSGRIETLHSCRFPAERHKLAICPGSQHEVLSASLSGKIFNIDLRCEQPETTSPAVLAETVAAGKSVKLQSISHHPLAPQICASYDDFHVRTFDKRRFDRALHEICPERLRSPKKPADISDCFYNYDGSEILAIYTDTDIFLFDSENKQPGEFKNTFRQMGFLAGFTNKTCFFGPKSEYVVVGDDGQRVKFIDKVTGEYVGHTALWPHGRWCSVYFNDLKPHPHLPVVVAAAGHFSVLSPSSVEVTTELPRAKKYEPTTKASKAKKSKKTRAFFQTDKQCNMQ